jgi:hypothetical protein
MFRIRFHLSLLAVLFLSACLGAFPTAEPGPTPLPTGLPSSPTTIPTETLLPEPTASPTQPVSGLYVDPAQDLGPISPFIYGSNFGPWTAIPADMIQTAYDSGITVLRFPGGAWGDRNDLKSYHVDQFMALIQKMGASAFINVRLRQGTPQAAAELVRYVNIQKGYNVRYWGIGNEPTLFAKELKEDYDTERFNREWRAIAEAMLAVDPTIQLIGPEVHQYSYGLATDVDTTNFYADAQNDSAGRNWVDEFLKANGDLVSGVSFHRYPFPASVDSGPPTRDDLRHNTQEWNRIIASFRATIHDITKRDLPIAITELSSVYNPAVGGEATPDSHFHAIWMGDVLGRLIDSKVFMVNQWLFATSTGQGGWGLITRGDVRPTFYTYQLYRRFGSDLLYAASDQDDVTVYAAKRPDGTLTIMLINLKSEATQPTLTVEGLTANASAEVWLLDTDHHVEQTASLSLSHATSLTLPPESMTLLVLKP